MKKIIIHVFLVFFLCGLLSCNGQRYKKRRCNDCPTFSYKAQKQSIKDLSSRYDKRS